MNRIRVGLALVTAGLSLAACGAAGTPAIAPPSDAPVAVEPAAVEPAAVAPVVQVALPALAPVAAIAPARWSGADGLVVLVPRNRVVHLDRHDAPLTDAELAAYGAQRMEPTQWVLRAGAAPCLAKVTDYFVNFHESGLARDGYYDESSIEATLDGCVPVEPEAPAVATDRAWVVAPSAIVGLGGQAGLRLVAAATTLSGNNAVDGGRSRRQAAVPKPYRAALALPKPSRGWVRDWTRHAVATTPALAQVIVEDVELAGGYDDDPDAWAPSELRAHTIFVGGVRSAIEGLPALAGALAVDGVARVALFDDGSQFATAAIVDGTLGEPPVHYVHDVAGY